MIETSEIPKWITKIPGVGSVVKSLTNAPPEAMKNKRLLWEAILLQFAIIVLDALTLDAMLRSIGFSAKLHHTFASFSMSSVASTLTLIPGGIGARLDAHPEVAAHEIGHLLPELSRGFDWRYEPGGTFARRAATVS